MRIWAFGLIAMLAAMPASAGVKEGVDAWQAGNYTQAVAEWRGPAQVGDADAQFNLGQAYKLGRGVPTDFKMAQDLFQKAAAQGHEQAQANLGLILFQNGDRRGAIPWIQKAAERGEPRAQYVLGTALFNGDLVERDWVRAYALMTRAAAAGLPQATTSLSQMDQYIPLEQRQKGIALARELDKPAPTPAVAPPPPPPAPKQIVKPVQLPPSAPPPPPAGSKPVPPKPVEVAKAPPPAPKPVPAPAPAPASAAKPTAGGWRVQLGAYANADAAKTSWTSVSAKVAAFKVLQPYLVKAGAFTRLQAGPFGSRAEASRACDAARAASPGCFPVAP